MKENFQIQDVKTGKIYWISRAIAVTGVIMAYNYDNHTWNILLERRGPGCPDNIGKLCCPCGYLNWEETRKDAIIRETYEETGIELIPDLVYEIETIDDPNRDARQNVVTRYACIVDIDYLLKGLTNKTINCESKSRGGEGDEVSELLVLTLDEIENMDPNEFAFNHKDVIQEIISKCKNMHVMGTIYQLTQNNITC